MRIVLTGGGTGGHLYPILAVVKALKKTSGDQEDMEFLFLGPSGDLEKEVMSQEFIPARRIASGKFRRYFSLKNISDFFKVPLGVIQSLWHLLVFMPDAVFAKGGYASFPVVFAAWLYRIPAVIHESDVTPGMTNHILGKFAKKIAISFPDTAKFFPRGKTILTGNPIRSEVAQGDVEKARKIFFLNPEKKTILVMGGSQGSQIINEAVVFCVSELLKKRRQIIHLTGKSQYEKVLHKIRQTGIKENRDDYHPFAYLTEDLPHAFAAADLVISRAGANAMTEIAANGKPAILIPLDGAANDHQKMNAFGFSQTGAAVVLEQENLGKNILLEKIEQILDNRELSYELSERIKKFYNTQSADLIAKEVKDVAS